MYCLRPHGVPIGARSHRHPGGCVARPYAPFLLINDLPDVVSATHAIIYDGETMFTKTKNNMKTTKKKEKRNNVTPFFSQWTLLVSGMNWGVPFY